MTKSETLASLVDPKVACATELQYGEMGHLVQKGKVTFYIHTGFVANDVGGIDKGLHIIVGERHVGRGNKLRRIWYFGTIEAPHSLSMTDEDRQRYDQKMLDILDNKNRVPGKNLESLIKKARMAY